jgi:hypothetical protein
MSNEVRKTHRNKVRAEQQFAAQMAGSGLTKEEFITRVKEVGFLYLTEEDVEAQVCTKTYTSADAPKTFAWFLSIIGSLTAIQINEATPTICPVSVVLATESPLPPLPTQNTEVLSTEAPVMQPTSSEPEALITSSNPSTELKGDSQLSSDVLDDTAAPTTAETTSSDLPNEIAVAPAKALKLGDPPYAASGLRKVFSAEASLSGGPAKNLAVAPDAIVTAPIWSPATTAASPKPSGSQVIIPTEAPLSPPITLESHNGTETSSEAMPNHLQGNVYKTTPFVTLAATAGAMVVGLVIIGGYFWKQKMQKINYATGDTNASSRYAFDGGWGCSLVGDSGSDPQTE